jgi:hypothetical protein
MKMGIKETAAVVLLGSALAVTTASARTERTVNLDQAKAAASAAFDRIERGDKDGTLEGRELKGRVTREELAAVDTDHDGTLSKEEYLALVEKLFREADTDNEGVLEGKELNPPPDAPCCG